MKRTLKISEILEKIDVQKREEIIKTFDECLKSICCEDILWKDFEIFKNSEEIIKSILVSLSPEYIMVVSDSIHEKYSKGCKVKITVKITKREEEVFIVKQSFDELMVIISITEKEYKVLRENNETIE